jgi:CspA family cold shock protein
MVKNDGGALGRPSFFFSGITCAVAGRRNKALKEQRSMSVYTGTVKWFNEAKGYGFIRRDDGPDLFVHYTNIVGTGFRTLKEDDKVEFEISEGPKGLQAVKVSKVQP